MIGMGIWMANKKERCAPFCLLYNPDKFHDEQDEQSWTEDGGEEDEHGVLFLF